MKLVMLHRKVPTQAHTSKGNENREPVQGVPRPKVMTIFRMVEKVNRVYRKLAQSGELHQKHGSRVSSLIRIHIEEVKRKVRGVSPAALQFIGPGDQIENFM